MQAQSLGQEDLVEKGIPTPVFLSRESHGQRRLTGYSPQGHKALDVTEVTQHAHARFPKNLTQWATGQIRLQVTMCQVMQFFDRSDNDFGDPSQASHWHVPSQKEEVKNNTSG